jgi:hypothetical protein
MLGIELRAHGDEGDAGRLGEFLELVVSETESVSEGDGLGTGSGESDGFELGERGAENVFYTRDALEKTAHTGWTELGSAGQGKHLAVTSGDGWGGGFRHKSSKSRV